MGAAYTFPRKSPARNRPSFYVRAYGVNAHILITYILPVDPVWKAYPIDILHCFFLSRPSCSVMITTGTARTMRKGFACGNGVVSGDCAVETQRPGAIQHRAFATIPGWFQTKRPMVPSRFLMTSQHQNSHGVHSLSQRIIGSVPIAFSDLRIVLYVSLDDARTGINPSLAACEDEQRNCGMEQRDTVAVWRSGQAEGHPKAP